MFAPKMRVTAPSAKFRVVGKLPGYVLRFNKKSDDGSGKGNIVPSDHAGDAVWGVVYEIQDHDREALDRSEGGYEAKTIEVETATGRLSVLAYVARADRIDDARRPYEWYKNFVVRGARQHGVSGEYIGRLEMVQAVNDSDAARTERNRKLLEG